MKTPTKEQIYEIIKKMPSEYSEFYFWGMSDEITEFIITEWEKIKDVDARVEKMCKNNPGIKDFEDFNKAINSPK